MSDDKVTEERVESETVASVRGWLRDQSPTTPGILLVVEDLCDEYDQQAETITKLEGSLSDHDVRLELEIARRQSAEREICDLHEDHWEKMDLPQLDGSVKHGEQILIAEGFDCIPCTRILLHEDDALYLEHVDKCWTRGEEDEMFNSGGGYPGCPPELSESACETCVQVFHGGAPPEEQKAEESSR